MEGKRAQISVEKWNKKKHEKIERTEHHQQQQSVRLQRRHNKAFTDIRLRPGIVTPLVVVG